jgi:anti-sigma factor RsiW
MSTNLHLSDDDLVLHYYGEMTAADETRTGAHLAGCADCQANYTRLQRVMAFVDSAPAVEPGPGFERIVWARLEPALPRT